MKSLLQAAIRLSGQLDSHHFYREQDVVRAIDGRMGTVVEAWSLFAVVAWDAGGREEIDQFDPSVLVVQRAGTE